jgi:hypothetical protein
MGLIHKNGHTIFLDDEDMALTEGKIIRVSEARWKNKNTEQTYYATVGDRRRQKFLHRVILGLSDPAVLVDHINGNGLDNRKSNLRVCNNQQNQANCRKQANTSSRYKGVRWHKGQAKWNAYIKVDGEMKYLGTFIEESKAAMAYNEAAVKYFGEFAKLNEVSHPLSWEEWD